MAAQTIVYSPLNSFATILASNSVELGADFEYHETMSIVYRSLINKAKISAVAADRPEHSTNQSPEPAKQCGL